MVPATGGATGWDAWSQIQAEVALQRYRRHVARVAKAQLRNSDVDMPAVAAVHEVVQPWPDSRPSRTTDTLENAPGAAAPADPKRAMIEAALRRARALRG